MLFYLSNVVQHSEIFFSSQSEILSHENSENFVEFFDGGQVDSAAIVLSCMPNAWEGRSNQVENVDS